MKNSPESEPGLPGRRVLNLNLSLVVTGPEDLLEEFTVYTHGVEKRLDDMGWISGVEVEFIKARIDTEGFLGLNERWFENVTDGDGVVSAVVTEEHLKEFASELSEKDSPRAGVIIFNSLLRYCSSGGRTDYDETRADVFNRCLVYDEKGSVVGLNATETPALLGTRLKRVRNFGKKSLEVFEAFSEALHTPE